MRNIAIIHADFTDKARLQNSAIRPWSSNITGKHVECDTAQRLLDELNKTDPPSSDCQNRTFLIIHQRNLLDNESLLKAIALWLKEDVVKSKDDYPSRLILIYSLEFRNWSDCSTMPEHIAIHLDKDQWQKRWALFRWPDLTGCARSVAWLAYVNESGYPMSAICGRFDFWKQDWGEKLLEFPSSGSGFFFNEPGFDKWFAHRLGYLKTNVFEKPLPSDDRKQKCLDWGDELWLIRGVVEWEKSGDNLDKALQIWQDFLLYKCVTSKSASVAFACTGCSKWQDAMKELSRLLPPTSSPKMSIEDLVNLLYNAHVLSPLSTPGHPENPEELSKALAGEPLSTVDLENDVEYYKALFYLNHQDMGKTRADDRRKIRLSVLRTLLAKVGITLEIPDNDIASEIQLPNAPGMVFVICLCNFLNALQQREIKLTLQEKNVVIEIPLDPDRTLRFYYAVTTATGGPAVQNYYRLLYCSKYCISTAFRSQKSYIDQWPPVPFEPAKGKSHVYEPLVEATIMRKECLLHITWEFDVSPTPTP